MFCWMTNSMYDWLILRTAINSDGVIAEETRRTSFINDWEAQHKRRNGKPTDIISRRFRLRCRPSLYRRYVFLTEEAI